MPHHHSSSDHSHGHGGHVHQPFNYNRAFALGLILNGGFVITEFGCGLLANSVALMADAGHNLSDVLALLLAWVGNLLLRRPASRRYTYGWRKSSILVAFLNGIILLVATGGILWEAVQRLLYPAGALVNSQMVIAVATLGIGINALTALMFASGRRGDMNIRAAFQHMAADALVSAGVVAAAMGIWLTHWRWLDPVLSLIICLFIIFSTWGLLLESFHLAIDGVPHGIDQRAIHSYLCERPGVTQVHDLHIWSMSTVETALTAHLVTPGGHPGDEFLLKIGQELRQHFGVQHVTLQIEVGDSSHPCLLQANCQV
ncbi:MAG: cation diffusion facilitator family transporter [Cyanobacteria bacterium REEB459]|nr:cation diffusion facilitator family transporter [Cyanobacteria bacterium REEB459]